MRLAALALLLFGVSAASASSTVGVRVQVQSVPGLTFSRQVPSVVTLTTPWGTQSASLSGGTLYTADPQHYWASLNVLRVRLKIPAGTAGRYPVSVRTTLYVCDQKIHLCSVRPSEAHGQLEVGSPEADTTPLTLILNVPGLRGF